MRIGRWLVVVVALAPWVGCTDGISVAVSKARQGDPVPLCRALCEHVSSCEIHADFEGVPACTRACAEREDAWSDSCREPMVALSACELRLSCAQLGALFDPDSTPAAHACEAETRAFESCQGDEFIYFQF